MSYQPVHHLVGRMAAAMPDRIAVERGPCRIGYATLETRARQIARAILEQNLEPGAPVAIFSGDSRHVLIALLGALKAGHPFVPLDPEMPEPRLRQMIEQARPRCVVTERARASVYVGLFEGSEPENPAGLIHFEDAAVLDPPAEPTDFVWDDESVAYVYFTSGSTGSVKGVAGRLKGVDHFIAWEIEEFGLGEECRVSQLTMPSFDAFLRDVFAPLCAGGTVCIPGDRETVLDPAKLIEWIDRSGIHLVHCVPTLFRGLLQAKPGPDRFRSLRYVLLAGEPLLPSDCAAWMDLFGERIRLVNLYGPTETTMTKFYYLVRAEDRDRKSIPIGQPMPGARALVMDRHLRPCPPGSVGEIYIRTPYRSLGYINRPDLTRAVFIPNPFTDNPKDLIYKTGDYARVLDDGNFEFLGRMDHQVKIRGLRVEPGEIEAVLSKHPAVREAVVVGRKIDPGSAAEQRLVAYLVPDDPPPEIAELREWLEQRLPEAMVPTVFVSLQRLPRTMQGKVDRRALPAPAGPGTQTRFVPPRTAVEELVAGIWADVLHRERIGALDHFFALGGHSLLATQVVSRLRESFNVSVRLTKIFNLPTVERLAAHLEELIGESTGLPSLQPVPREGKLGLSYAQEQLWFLDRLNPGNSNYNIPIAVRLEGELDPVLLQRGIENLVRRHEALRTVFGESEGVPEQIILPELTPAFPMIDLSGLPDEVRAGVLFRLSSGQAQAPFNLSAGPLFRVMLVRERGQGPDRPQATQAAARHVIQLNMHHIVSDGWSMQVLFEETVAFYSGLLRGRAAALPELSVQYADYSHWQRTWLTREKCGREIAYWKTKLAGAPASCAIPADRERPEVFTYRGRRVATHLDAALTRSLRTLSRRENATLFMTLTAGFLAVLRHRTGSDDLIVGTDLANRHHTAIERMIGFFVNQIPLRVSAAGELSFKAFLERVRLTVLEAYGHQDIPFHQLVESLSPARDPSRGPLFQTKLVLQNVPAAETAAPNGLRMSPVEAEQGTAQLDLILNLSESETGISGSLEYCTDLYREQTVQGFLRQLNLVWGWICREPGMTLHRIDELLAEEASQARLERRREQKREEGQRLEKFLRRPIPSA